jgi:hypothetical protein
MQRIHMSQYIVYVGWTAGVRFPEEETGLFFLDSVLAGSGAKPTSCPMAAEGEAAGS